MGQQSMLRHITKGKKRKHTVLSPERWLFTPVQLHGGFSDITLLRFVRCTAMFQARSQFGRRLFDLSRHLHLMI